MSNNISYLKNTLGQYFIFVLFIFAFITYPGATEGTEDPIVWYITGYPIIYVAGIALLFFVVYFLRGIIIDRITVLLFARAIACLIPIIYIDSISSFSAHYPVVLITLVSYCIGRITNWKFERYISSLIILFGIILSIQVIQTFFTVPVDYFNLNYKHYIRIPIAASNVIAAYLTPILFLFIYNYNPKRIIKILIIALFITGIILTKSRGGIFVLLATYITYNIFIKHKFKISHVIAIIIVIGLLFYYISSIPEVQLFLLGFSADNTTIDANSISSNRFNIFEEELDRFLNYPLFGNGMVFNEHTSKSGAHNLIIELLVQSGIIGTLLYIIPIVIVFNKAAKNKDCNNILGWRMFLIAMLYHGMLEVNFFNYSTDILFWSICGLLMSNSIPQTNVSNKISTATSSVQ